MCKGIWPPALGRLTTTSTVEMNRCLVVTFNTTDAKGRSVTRYRSGVEIAYVAHKKNIPPIFRQKQTTPTNSQTIHTKNHCLLIKPAHPYHHRRESDLAGS